MSTVSVYRARRKGSREARDGGRGPGPLVPGELIRRDQHESGGTVVLGWARTAWAEGSGHAETWSIKPSALPVERALGGSRTSSLEAISPIHVLRRSRGGPRAFNNAAGKQRRWESGREKQRSKQADSKSRAGDRSADGDLEKRDRLLLGPGRHASSHCTACWLYSRYNTSRLGLAQIDLAPASRGSGLAPLLLQLMLRLWRGRSEGQALSPDTHQLRPACCDPCT